MLDTIKTTLIPKRAIKVVHEAGTIEEYVEVKLEDASIEELKNSQDEIFLEVSLQVNDMKFTFNEKYLDIQSMIFDSLDDTCYFDRVANKKNAEYSDFYPFTCSCGESGCAGLWNGIRVKPRKFTVEWRASKDDGYGFLGKTFFSFNRREYEAELPGLAKRIREFEELFGRKVTIIMDTYGNGDTYTLDKVEKFIKKLEKKLKKDIASKRKRKRSR